MRASKSGRAGRLAKVSLLTLVVTGLTSLAALAQSVVVQGNRRVDAETIRGYVTGRGGDLNAARQDLLGTGLFSSVNVSRRGGSVVVSVSENNVVNRVAFEGNSKVKSDILRGEVQSRAGGSYNPELVQRDVERVREVYRRAGRGLAQVNARTVDLPNGRLDIVFTVDEGAKTGVKEINFVGNDTYSSSRLRNLINTTEMNLLSFLKTSDVYDPDRVAADQELIRRFYLKNGYADFRFVNNEARFDEAKGGWIITMTVDEGPQYKVAGVRVDSRIADIDTGRLEREVLTGAGSVYSAEAVEKSVVGMTTEAGRRGYAFAQVRPQGQRDAANRTINLVYVVEEGPRVYVERINVRGNTRTRDYVIRREFDVAEGDAYNKVLVDRAERRLNNLGFFKKVRITNEPGSSPDRVIVNVDVEDQPTGSLSLAGGYSTSDGFLGEVSVSESNFLGTGQFVRLAGSSGQYSRGIDFSFTEPYFLGYRLAAGFDVFSKENDNLRFTRTESRQTGGTLRLGVPLTEEWSAGIRYSLYETKIKIPNDAKNPFNDCSFPITGVTPGTAGAPPISATANCLTNGEASVAQKEAAGRTITSAVGLSLTYNTLDNIKDPRSGIFGELRQDVAGLGGDARYYRASFDGRYYRELTDDLVGLLRVQGGHILGFGGGRLSINDHFQLGPSLVRGFAPGGLGPRDIAPGIDTRYSALGSTTYVGASAEVQFPIFGLPREIGLRGAVFADAGTTFGFDGGRAVAAPGCPAGTKARQFNVVIDPLTPAPPNGQTNVACIRDSHVIRSSVGASLLWASPFGPIRFDYAWALSKDKYDRTQAFRFSGGARF
jgi:outer membrane protein insertion porin family